MSDSESSGLSSPPPTDDESPPPVPLQAEKQQKGKISSFFKKLKSKSPSQSPEPERPPSPPHEYVLADNSDIAVVVMFRSRFAEAFPRNSPNVGPQDIESGVVSSQPSDQVEGLLCALLGLVLNRKKDVEKGHYGRALEDAVSAHRSQWPASWQGINPVSGSKSFNTMGPTERIELLKALTIWSLNSSEVISATIKESYKQARHEDDLNQPLSVQPWGIDDKKRRYWLIEGNNDTPFRVYRENAIKESKKSWFSIAGSIEEAKELAVRLQTENKSQAAIRFSKSIYNAVPRFEEVLEKRKRKEYRQARKAAFARPEPGVSLYEGRTRGKRARYTFDDDDDDYGSDGSVRKSLRNTSGGSTPVDALTVTASGRQVRSRFGRSYGDRIDTQDNSDRASSEDMDAGLRRSGRARGTASRTQQILNGDESADELGDEEDEADDNAWSGDDNDVTGKFDDDEDMTGSSGDEDELANKELLVVLKYPKGSDITPKSNKSEDAMANGDVDGDHIMTDAAESTKPHDRSPSPQKPQPISNGTNHHEPSELEKDVKPSFSQFAYSSPQKTAPATQPSAPISSTLPLHSSPSPTKSAPPPLPSSHSLNTSTSTSQQPFAQAANNTAPAASVQTQYSPSQTQATNGIVGSMPTTQPQTTALSHNVPEKPAYTASST